MQEEYTLVFDGDFYKSLGVAGGTYLLIDNRDGQRYTSRTVMPEITSPHHASYRTLLTALQALSAVMESKGETPDHLSLEIRGDNQLVIRQLSGEWRTKASHLRMLHHQVRQILERFHSYTLLWQSHKESEEFLGPLSPAAYQDMVETSTSGRGRPEKVQLPGLGFTLEESTQGGESDYILIFDGGKQGDTGPAYGSYALIRGRDGKRRVERLRFQEGLTSNEAEYQALIAGLEDLISTIEEAGRSPKEFSLEVRGDSRLVLSQVAGKWKMKALHLMPLRDKVEELLERFGSIALIWQRRDKSERVLGH